MASTVVNPGDILFDVVMPIGEKVGDAVNDVKNEVLESEATSNSDEETKPKKSSGFAIGFKGSPMWNATASQEVIYSYYSNMETLVICNEWERRWESPRIRKNLSKTLLARGEDPMYCSSTADDERKRVKKEIDKMKRETTEMKQEMEELQDAKDELDKLKREMNLECINSGGVMVGNKCLY